MFYYDSASMSAVYTASADKVRGLLPDSRMAPVELYPGRCLAVFTAFEYRETDIGPYNEFSIAFLAALGKRQIPGLTAMRQMSRRRFTAYVWQLPVTTEIARVGGVEMHGYPKFLADIRFEKGDEWTLCTLSAEGKMVLTLRGKVLPTTRGKVTRVRTYSFIDGIPLVANVVMDPLRYAESRRKDAARLELGSGHAISGALREIGLGERPVAYQYSPSTQAILFGGRRKS